MPLSDIRHFEQLKIFSVMNFRRFRLSERIILVSCPCQGALPNIRLKTSRSFMDMREGNTHCFTLPGGGAFLGRGKSGKSVLHQMLDLAKRLEISRIGLCAHSPCLYTEGLRLMDVLWRLYQANQKLMAANPNFEISPCFVVHHPPHPATTHWVDLKILEDYHLKSLSAA